MCVWLSVCLSFFGNGAEEKKEVELEASPTGAPDPPPFPEIGMCTFKRAAPMPPTLLGTGTETRLGRTGQDRTGTRPGQDR